LCKFPKPLYIQKSKFYSEIILLSFWPIRRFGPATAHSLFLTGRFSLSFPLGLGLPADPAHHHGPTSRCLLPPAPKPSMALPLASLVPPPRSPRRLHRKRKTAASNSPSFARINWRHFPPLQSHKLAPSTPPLKLLQAGN
jgi:hypothetical protein